AISFGPRPQTAEGSRNRGIHRPASRPDDPAYAGARARPARLQDLQRLLVLRPADGGGAAPRPARRAAALPSRLGHQQRATAKPLGKGREGGILSVRKNAGATVSRTGLILRLGSLSS